MLNENEIEKILGCKLGSVVVSDIHWRAQDSTSSSVLFYKIGFDQVAEESFKQRIAQAKFAWLVVNRKVPGLPVNSCIIDEVRWPLVQKEILDLLYPLPPVKLIAITGTNGKTTTADLILQLGHLLNRAGLSIGTLGVREYGHTILDFGLTSPSFIDLRKFLYLYGRDKDFCVMETSSHALVQDRFFGLSFDGAGWTSFSQDHLDYHQTMENYFEAKALLLTKLNSHARLYVPCKQIELLSQLRKRSSRVLPTQSITEKLPLFLSTTFNRDNLEVAWDLLRDIFPTATLLDFTKLTSPEGRFFIRNFGSSFIIVDFAHTPDALENICQAIRENFPQHKLKLLFGCGGDRDRGKRSLMGKVASQLADHIYVTSDNPRNEDPDQIIQDIMTGIHRPANALTIITDRKEAVRVALYQLTDQEVLLLAGKGHEDYILSKGIKYPYSDIQQVEDFILRKTK
jgi:UDP-N-acetylmuramoyl-L-alanyl-D-glutamate--2,6-diaminopimelate ligase